MGKPVSVHTVAEFAKYRVEVALALQSQQNPEVFANSNP